ncbi:MAG: S8 family serine peptidase [Puia sp.]|nr:S8 family serine peptidase [Puia sp.]
MQKNWIVPITLLLLLNLSITAVAQTTTNRSILEQASRLTAQNEKTTQKLLLSLAAQKGWPLTIKNRHGRVATLHGIDGKGNPLYLSVDDNIISAATIHTNLLWPGGSTGLNLNGSSAFLKGKIAIWDEAKPRPTHHELTGRVVQEDGATSISDHSTHVAGTMIASGVNPLAKGMSYGALQLHAYDYNNDNSEMMGAASDLVISNHSYGYTAGWNYNTDVSPNRWEFWGNYGDTADYKFGYYSSDAQAWDSIAYNAPNYLIVKAAGNNRTENGPAVGTDYWRYNQNNIMSDAGARPAGISSNDGYDIISTNGCSKNILTLGAVNPIPGGYSSVNDVSIADFSSWGPTDDGRIKPDVVTDGVNVLSCIGTSDSAYDTYSGTSMATPAASGSLFLLQQYYTQLHNDSLMRSATLKGIIIHTADEAGIADGPDYIYGWGLINMQKAAAVITSRNSDQLIYENLLTNTTADSIFTLPVVASGKGDLIATISWTDPAGTPVTTNLLNNPTKMLVNDLDLRITQEANTWKPYTLDRTNPGSAATTGDDTLNNVEKIVIKNAIPGQAYTLKVTHKGTLARGSQAYSLIVSGVGGSAYCASAALNNGGTRIDSVVVGNMNNANLPAGACTTYTSYANVTDSIQPNQKLPVRIRLSSCDGTTNSRVVKIFIDYNSDGVFGPGEQAAVSGVLPGGVTDYTDTIVTPATLATGNFGLMRVVAEETTDTGAVAACGTYSNGETEDFRAAFVDPTNDVGIVQIVDPAGSGCAGDSQLVTVQLKNFGSVAQSKVPITVIISSGGTPVATLNAIYPATLPAFGYVNYTLQTGFTAVAGTTYTITGYTSLSGDQLASDDTASIGLVISTGEGAPTGVAELCGSDKVYLKATNAGSGQAFWYTGATGGTPVATGVDTSTVTIPSNHTYYLGLNDASTSVGPFTKQVFPSGGYNVFNYNFINFTSYVPVTIQSARLYIAYPGKITFTVAQLNSFDTASGDYQETDISSTTINAYPTYPSPQYGALNTNSASDTGAIYYLGLSVPTAGNYIIYITTDSASIFRNNGITANPYPMTIPGIFSITGNSAVTSASPTMYEQYYYFFYDMKIKTLDCPATTRTAVVAQTATAPVISLNGNVLSSTSSAAYQWYLNDSLLAGDTHQNDTALYNGVYKVVVTDSTGCSQTSNSISYSSSDGGDISLHAFPNPSQGSFTLDFSVASTNSVDVILIDMLGQEVYHQSYPDFTGVFSKLINGGNLSAGVYYLKVLVGSKVYVKKILIAR